MANANRDNNYVTTALAVLNTDGSTTKNIAADPSTNCILCVNGDSGSDNGPTNAARDSNAVPILMATSSADGITPVAVYADSNGKLLIKTS